MVAKSVDTDLTVTGVVDATTMRQGGAALALGSSVTALETTRGTGTLGVVIHATIASTARPTGYAAVCWIGTIEPTNAINNDFWIDSDA